MVSGRHLSYVVSTHVYSVISSQSSIQKEVLPSESRDNPATEKLLETVDVKQSRFNHFQVHMYAKFNDPHCIRHVCKLSLNHPVK